MFTPTAYHQLVSHGGPFRGNYRTGNLVQPLKDIGRERPVQGPTTGAINQSINQSSFTKAKVRPRSRDLMWECSAIDGTSLWSAVKLIRRAVNVSLHEITNTPTFKAAFGARPESII